MIVYTADECVVGFEFKDKDVSVKQLIIGPDTHHACCVTRKISNNVNHISVTLKHSKDITHM